MTGRGAGTTWEQTISEGAILGMEVVAVVAEGEEDKDDASTPWRCVENDDSKS